MHTLTPSTSRNTINIIGYEGDAQYYNNKKEVTYCESFMKTLTVLFYR